MTVGSRIAAAWRSLTAGRPITVGRTPMTPGLDAAETPRISVLQVVRLPCRLCGVALRDGDLVVWFERKKWRSDLAHAECAVFIKNRDGTIARPSGAVVETEPNIVAGTLLLTEEEWFGWVASARVTPEAV